jgi:3-oxoacyl-[acyl-carrier protein] reductase
MHGLLSNKVVVVTGAATGIGEGITRLFAEQGARVAMLDRDRAQNEQTARSISGVVRPHVCDVSNRCEIEAAVAAVVNEFGCIDVLVNNAGVYPRQPFLQMSEQQWDEVHDVNLKSMFHSCQVVLPHMLSRKAGKIINISSVTFHVGLANLSHYVAAKGGIIGFTRSLAREMGQHGVLVNCVTPGAILVATERKMATEEQISQVIGLQSIRRRLLPIDVARVCSFLATELSDGMTGQTINVDGGWAMY